MMSDLSEVTFFHKPQRVWSSFRPPHEPKAVWLDVALTDVLLMYARADKISLAASAAVGEVGVECMMTGRTACCWQCRTMKQSESSD